MSENAPAHVDLLRSSTAREASATTAEVGSVLRLSPASVRRLLAAGELRGVKTSSGGRSHWRIAPSELSRFLEEGPRR
jgi:excisionase family DNA binding protein